MSEPTSVVMVGGMVGMLLLHFCLGVFSGYRLRRRRWCPVCAARTIQRMFKISRRNLHF